VDLAVQLLVWSPISAALTALVALLLLTLVRPLYRPQAA
jgi:rod shape-determining protein MreD